MEESKEELEARISAAMLARLDHFKSQADTLTLEVVRREIEADLGIKKFTLDAHKKFVKQWIDKHFNDPAESDLAKNSEVNLGCTVESGKGEKKGKSEGLWYPDTENDNKNRKDVARDVNEEIEMKSETINGDEINEEKIKKAVEKRAKYFRENCESITLSGARRLLEEDLKLARNSLDTFKVLIKEQVGECLSGEAEKSSNGAKASKTKKPTQGKRKTTATKMTKRNEEGSGSEGSDDLSGIETSSGSEDTEEGDVVSRKRTSRDLKGKIKPLKKQKISAKESKPSGLGKKHKGQGSGDTEDLNASDDSQSKSSEEGSSKKTREKPAPVYGKNVEHLKSIIKSCGMSVPPSIYKKVKDAAESKREAILIKELEGILEREGLSRNPSEKEIKALKKRKEKAKELEGIDMGNIVSSSRRRTASSYIPPKPQIPVESDEDETDGGDDEEDDSGSESSDNGASSGGSEEDADEESD